LREKIAKVQKKIGDKKELPQDFKEAKNIIMVYRKMVGDSVTGNRFVDSLERLNDKVKAL
jgi:hypothetical protein